MANLRVVIIEVAFARVATQAAPTGETLPLLRVLDVAGQPLYRWDGTAWVLFI